MMTGGDSCGGPPPVPSDSTLNSRPGGVPRGAIQVVDGVTAPKETHSPASWYPVGCDRTCKTGYGRDVGE